MHKKKEHSELIRGMQMSANKRRQKRVDQVLRKIKNGQVKM